MKSLDQGWKKIKINKSCWVKMGFMERFILRIEGYGNYSYLH